LALLKRVCDGVVNRGAQGAGYVDHWHRRHVCARPSCWGGRTQLKVVYAE
jgi:hypothetical protein